MSGGSYEYLCFKDADEIRNQLHQLESMAERLAGLGYAPDVARETVDLLLTLRQQYTFVSAYIDRLSPIWRAVEWCDSGDSGEDHIKEALHAYRGSPEHEHRYEGRPTWRTCAICGAHAPKGAHDGR